MYEWMGVGVRVCELVRVSARACVHMRLCSLWARACLHAHSPTHARTYTHSRAHTHTQTKHPKVAQSTQECRTRSGGCVSAFGKSHSTLSKPPGCMVLTMTRVNASLVLCPVRLCARPWLAAPNQAMDPVCIDYHSVPGDARNCSWHALKAPLNIPTEHPP